MTKKTPLGQCPIQLSMEALILSHKKKLKELEVCIQINLEKTSVIKGISQSKDKNLTTDQQSLSIIKIK
jgi:hypothetical protein